MRLADFIEQHARDIVDGAERFAKTQAPIGSQLSVAALRNDIPRILDEIVRDLRTSQEPSDQKAKSEGRLAQPSDRASAASHHGLTRARLGFDVNHMVAEYRALRAQVLRRWAEDKALSSISLDDMIRFNEAIDQALAESLLDFTQEFESWRHIFLGVLAHDLRGPLAAIVSNSELLSRMTAGSASQGFADHIVVAGEHMSRLLKSLLDYNKAQLGLGMDIEVASCDLNDVLQAEVGLLRQALPTAVIDYRGEGPMRGMFDALRMREALHNLVTNAFKYGHPGAEIAVTLAAVPHGVELTVRNSGEPLPPQWSDAMFDPLRRGGSTAFKDEKASLGLGLYVVQQVVKAHGGYVTARSADGQTTFAVWLPLQANGVAAPRPEGA